MKIRELDISARARHCLLAAGYEYLSELRCLSDEDFLEIHNFNQSCLDEIKTKLEKSSEEGNILTTDDECSNRVYLDNIISIAKKRGFDIIFFSIISYI